MDNVGEIKMKCNRLCYFCDQGVVLTYNYSCKCPNDKKHQCYFNKRKCEYCIWSVKTPVWGCKYKMKK